MTTACSRRGTTSAGGRRRRSWVGRAALVALLLVAPGCGRDAVAVYRDSAVSALEASLSEGRTAELAGRLWVGGRSTHPLAVVVVRDSDQGLGSEASWFEEQQPPGPAGDRIRQQTVQALDAASSAVQDVRIALERSDEPATRAALGELRSACSDLESLAEGLG